MAAVSRVEKAKPRYAMLLAILVFAQAATFAQSGSIRSDGVAEPKELTGEPKKIKIPSDRLRQFLKSMEGAFKDEESGKIARRELSKLIQQYPGYSDAHFMRATLDLCNLDRADRQSVLNDIEAAISTYVSEAPDERMYDSRAEHYALRAKMKFDAGRYREAMDDLDIAIKEKIDSADQIFRIQGVEPEIKSNPCSWSKSDLDLLVQRFPKDYRVYVYRGLYLSFFVPFKGGDSYYRAAIDEFQKASTLNLRAALPRYFIGCVHSRAQMWPKTQAAASDEARNEMNRKALQSYTAAIELDPKFIEAYEKRANVYLELKLDRQAIKDYDKVLEHDPENAGAYNDRALAKMSIGQVYSAISDLGDAIQRKGPESSTLALSYEHRADAYMKVGESANAVADLTKAIERRLANDSFLMSLHDLRAIYPEYKTISEEEFVRKIHGLFWPEFTYEVVAKQLLNNKDFSSPLLADLFVKRGDAYLKANAFKKAIAEFNRVFSGFGEYGKMNDRWRLLGNNPAAGDYLDVKTVEFLPDRTVRLWLKTVSTKPTYTVSAQEIDCKSRRIRQTSSVVYNSDGNPLNGSGASGGWQPIIPDSFGEHLYNGSCAQ